MKIVIDISEEAYKLLQNEGVDWLGAEHILNAVANGIPLSECHGSLKDIEALDDLFFKATDYPNVKLSYEEISDILLDAPTIIEADRAEGSNNESNKNVL